MLLEEHKDREMIIAEMNNLGLTNALFAAVPASKVLDNYVYNLPNHQYTPLFWFRVFCVSFFWVPSHRQDLPYSGSTLQVLC